MKRVILFCVAFILLSSNILFAKTYDISQIANCKLVTEYSENTTVDQMDTVTFGSYPQSDASGNIKEPIEWIVLDRQGNKHFLLSKYILDCKPYNEEQKDVTWEDCTLRSWLNSVFLNTAFDSSKQKNIENTDVINVDNWSGIHGNNTIDKVFCLGRNDVEKYFQIAARGLGTRGTDYAKSLNNNSDEQTLHVYGSTKYDFYVQDWCKGNSDFWNRSVDYWYYETRNNGRYGGIIDYSGSYRTIGLPVESCNVGVRPALWVDTSSYTSQNSVISRNTNNSSSVNGSISGTNSKLNNGSVVVTSDEVDGVYYIDDYDSTRIVVKFNKSGSKKIKDGTKRNLNKYLYVIVGSDEPIRIYVEKTVDDGVATVYIPEKYRNFWTKGAAERVNNKELFAYIAENVTSNSTFDSGMTMTKNEPDKLYANSSGNTIIQNPNTIKGLPSRQSEHRNDNYFYLNNAMQKNAWVFDGKDYYHVDGQGIIEKNKWIDQRYVGSDGKLYRGRQTPDGKYVGDDGRVVNIVQDLVASMQVETVQPDSWYKTQSGLWYYFENDRTTTKKGWFHDKRDNQWYYLDLNTGIMQVGWVNVGGKDYYFNESHSNANNWYETGDGFFESYGKKVKAYGSMFKSEKTPDGYWVNHKGEYVKNGNFITVMDPKILIGAIIGLVILLVLITKIKRNNKNNIN